MVDVFISYKRQERAQCERIADKLRALDLDVWFDARLESGRSFDREIEESIKKAKAVLVLWSPAAVESEWVRNEATIGKQRDVLVAVQIAPCTLPIAFTNTHFEPLYDPRFPDDDAGWLKVLDRIGRLCARPGLVAFSRTLGEAQGKLQGWIDANPADKLAPRMRAVVRSLAGMDEAPAEMDAKRKGAGLAAVLGAALLAAGAGAAGGWTLAPRSAAVAPAGEGVAAETLAAARLIGKWALPADLGGDCANPIVLTVGPGQLRLSGAAEQSDTVVRLDDAGWLVTKSAEGGDFAYRIEGGKLMMRVGAAGDAQPFEACP